MPKQEFPRVVIVGGGFGGLAAAKALCALPTHNVLIDRQNHHLFNRFFIKWQRLFWRPDTLVFQYASFCEISKIQQ
jgi:NADH:ubiquinone reductase (H+-translocating)